MISLFRLSLATYIKLEVQFDVWYNNNVVPMPRMYVANSRFSSTPSRGEWAELLPPPDYPREMGPYYLAGGWRVPRAILIALGKKKLACP